MPPRAITISPSQLDAQSCRLKWYWSYKKGYRAKKRNMNLLLGDGVHQGLQAYYQDAEDPVKVFLIWMDKQIAELDQSWSDTITEIQNAKDLGEAMLTGYMETYDGKDDFTIIPSGVERTLRAKLKHPDTGEDSPYTLVARLDGLVRDHHTGRIFSLEHKTFTTFNEGHLAMDDQMTAQVCLGQSLVEFMDIDEEVVGVVYNGLRKAIPTKRTKSPLFQRRRIFRTSRQIEVFLHRAYWQCHEFNHPNLQIYPQPDQMKCGWCELRAPCLEYKMGGDYQSILKEMFIGRGQSSGKGKRKRSGNKSS